MNPNWQAVLVTLLVLYLAGAVGAFIIALINYIDVRDSLYAKRGDVRGAARLVLLFWAWPITLVGALTRWFSSVWRDAHGEDR